MSMIGILSDIPIEIVSNECILRLGAHRRTRVSAALNKHVHVELALGDVTSIAVQALQKDRHRSYSDLEERKKRHSTRRK